MSYPNPDFRQLPNQEPRMKVIHSLPASIKLETIEDELYKQGFAIIPTALSSMIYIPKQVQVQPPQLVQQAQVVQQAQIVQQAQTQTKKKGMCTIQ